ncbi:NAD-binding protein [Sediminibacterium ginsengisoli]|uniref:TrkA-N domain-containing protein n=1 Tax=Sediminibacterium ginsengisoli TaxID=413434 RepID=A0A1T4PMH2_9BACT|nr:NAD-binding protein [Sediminibacterium ginsengisoli]SJZ92702.1 TrkA-N domain-containing protein [Sediminibacterium ginsengisoli]
MNFKKVRPFIFPVLIVLVFAFSIAGFHQSLGDKFNFWGVLFAIFNFFIMNDADPVEVSDNIYILIAKYLAAVLVGFGLFSLSYNYLRRLFLTYRIRFTYTGHIIIFSLDHAGKSIADRLIDNGYKVVVVEHDKENPFIEEMEDAGCVVITDSPFEKKTLDDIGLLKAKMCILAHTKDATNIEIANKVSEYIYQNLTEEMRKGHDALKILVHIDEQDNIEVIKDYFDINNSDEHYDLHAFNIDELAAQKIYDSFPPYQYGGAVSQQPEHSIAVIGGNKTAEAFILENMILGHYAGRPPLKIYLVDKDADTFYHAFRYRYPFCEEFIELIPVTMLNSSFFANFAWSKEHIEQLSKVQAAYFFGESDSVVMNTAASFRQFLYIQTLGISQVPLIIALPEDSGIYEFLNDNSRHRDEVHQLFTNTLNMHYVKRQSDSFSGKSLIEETALNDSLARVINYYYSVSYEFENILTDKLNVTPKPGLAQQLTDFIIAFPQQKAAFTEQEFEAAFFTYMSQLTSVSEDRLNEYFSIKKRWNILNNRKKDSNRYAARNINVKFHMMKEIGCWPVNTENILKFYPRLAEVEHKRWSAEKMVFNYKFGPFPADKKEKYILKEVLKIHNQLIPYEQLTEGEKQKDLNLFMLLPLLYSLKQSGKS